MRAEHQSYADIQDLPAYELAAELPQLPGVYFFYNRSGECIYIGKSIHIRKRVLSHFSARRQHRKENLLATLTHRIDYKLTAGDIGARLLENRLIKSRLPVYNRRQRRNKQPFTFERHAGHLQLSKLSDVDNIDECFGLFRNYRQAQLWLGKLCKQHRLCEPVLLNRPHSSHCFNAQLGSCANICSKPTQWAQHLNLAERLLSDRKLSHWPYNGAVLIKEHCESSKQTDWHLVDNWCHLGSWTQTAPPNAAQRKASKIRAADIDTHCIIASALNNFSQAQADNCLILLNPPSAIKHDH